MGQPKAKWPECSGVWFARVGQYQLEVSIGPSRGEWVVGIFDDDSGDDEYLVRETVPVPCDLPDLMRLAEAELARRLRGAADSMDGRELVVAAPKPANTCAFDGCDAEPCGKYFRPDLCVDHARQDERENFQLRYSTVEFDQTCYLCGRTKATTQKLHEEHLMQCKRHPPQEHLTIGPAEAYEMVETVWGSVRIGARKSPDPYQKAALEFSRKFPPCTVCGVVARLCVNYELNAVGGAYGCGHTEAQRVRGSREWAIALMANGNTARDRYGKHWEWRGGPRIWIGNGAAYVARTACELPADGWDLPPL